MGTQTAMDGTGEITRLLALLEEGRSASRRAVLERLVPLVYRELKELARANRYRWSGERAPGTTSLVHEAYLKLAMESGRSFASRRHFYAVASKAMRSILIDNARWLGRQKRGGGDPSATLEESMLASTGRSEELLALDEALDRLDEREPRLVRIVECRCFGGLTVAETAEALEVSPATVKRGWSLAQAWLYRELQAAPA